MEEANIRLSWDSEHIRPSGSMTHFLSGRFATPDPTGSNEVAELLAPGASGVFAFSGNTLVGIARAFSDTLTTTWLAELCVAPDWLDRGIEKLLLAKINDRFRGTALYCAPSIESVEIFKAAGIRPKEKLITCHRPPGTAAKELGVIAGIIIHDDSARCDAPAYYDVVDCAFGISNNEEQVDSAHPHLFGAGISGFFAETMEGCLVGIVRVFSDDMTKSYVAEICVRPEWQRRGIGRALLERAVARFSHTAIWTEAFPDAVPLFESCEVERDPNFVGCSRAPLE